MDWAGTWARMAAAQPEWLGHAAAWERGLLADVDLAGKLAVFCREKLARG